MSGYNHILLLALIEEANYIQKRLDAVRYLIRVEESKLIIDEPEPIPIFVPKYKPGDRIICTQDKRYRNFTKDRVYIIEGHVNKVTSDMYGYYRLTNNNGVVAYLPENTINTNFIRDERSN